MLEFMTAMTYTLIFVVGMLVGAVGMDLYHKHGGDDDGLTG